MEPINQETLNEFLKKENIFAVIGVSNDKKKYGNKVYLDLKSAGYIVYPVNPYVSSISGDRCYPNLKDLPMIPDVVDIVVPPKITEKIVKECYELGIDKVWMQPGSESENAILFCRENGLKILYGFCIMLERRKERRDK
jgi:predicted CoA-binding protein